VAPALSCLTRSDGSSVWRSHPQCGATTRSAYGDCCDGQPEPPNAAPPGGTVTANVAAVPRPLIRQIRSGKIKFRREGPRAPGGANLAPPLAQNQPPATATARPPRPGSTRAHITHRGASRSGLFVASRVFPPVRSLQDPCSSPRAECSPLVVEIPSELKSKVVPGRLSSPHYVARRVGVKLRQNVPAPLQQRCRHT
jgi:hypothetical protein